MEKLGRPCFAIVLYNNIIQYLGLDVESIITLLSPTESIWKMKFSVSRLFVLSRSSKAHYIIILYFYIFYRIVIVVSTSANVRIDVFSLFSPKLSAAHQTAFETRAHPRDRKNHPKISNDIIYYTPRLSRT